MGYVRLPSYGSDRPQRQWFRPEDVGRKRQDQHLRVRQLHLTGLRGTCRLPWSTGPARGRFMVFLQQYRCQCRQAHDLHELRRYPGKDIYGGCTVHQPLPDIPWKLYLRQSRQERQAEPSQPEFRKQQPLYPCRPYRQEGSELRHRVGPEFTGHSRHSQMPCPLPVRPI